MKLILEAKALKGCDDSMINEQNFDHLDRHVEACEYLQSHVRKAKLNQSELDIMMQLANSGYPKKMPN